MELPVMPPVRPMLAKAVDGIPDGDLAFEPKWDGFRCIVFRDGDEVVLGSRNDRPLTRYFPELIDPLRAVLPERAVLDGELIVRLDDDRLGFDALQQRIHPAQSRIERLADETPAELVFFDLLAAGDSNLMSEPFRYRRNRLKALGGPFEKPINLAPATLDRTVAQDWYTRFEGAGLDGLIAKPRDGAYICNRRVQFKVKHTRTLDVVVAGYRMHRDGAGVGSLLVALHDAAGNLNHCGVAASFTARRRTELLSELAAFCLDDPAQHPWAAWLDPAAHSGEALMPGAPNRWSGGRESKAWVPLRPELVAEVKYEAILNGRFRGTTRLIRWRGDRTPESCNYDQVEVPLPVGIDEVLAAQG